MTITSYQIHNVLRTYGKQLRRGARLNRVGPAETGERMDKINISAEARRQQVVERVATEIMSRLADSGPRREGVESEILSDLSQEFGQPLQLGFDTQNDRFSFNVVDVEKGEIVKTLDKEQTERLTQRLREITLQKVDQTML
ncbi:MAG: hypothetical protein KKB20_28240 [Proteobacteria bacterium]|nr:hypothetical protein [Pseudomonadota bacterium]